MNLDKNAIYVVIAAYNEGTAIAAVLDDLRAEGYRNIVVVNDGSRDNTAETVRAKGATVLSHIVNLGQGAALQTGIEYAFQKGAAFVATFDADGQHSAADIAALWSRLTESAADIALGSRFLGKAENITFLKKMVLKAGILVNYMFTGLLLTDAHNGLRLLTRKAVEEIRIDQDGMAHATEILENIAQRGLKFIEVPVTIRYTRYSKEKGQKLSNSVGIFIDTLLAKLDKF